MRRHRLGRHKSRKLFRKHSKVHKRNYTMHTSRGGIRL